MGDDHKMKKICIILSILIIGVVLLYFRPIMKYNYQQRYNAAWDMVMDGKYKEAREEFDDICKLYASHKYYANRGLYISSCHYARAYCSLCISYQNENYRHCYNKINNELNLKNGRMLPVKLNQKQRLYIEETFAGILETYDAHKAEYVAQDRERERAEEIRRKTLPYIGMSEELIDSTDLGPHTKYYEHYNTGLPNGTDYDTSMYRWEYNGESVCVVRCMDGKVWFVWDNPDYLDMEGLKSSYQPNTMTESSHSSKTNSRLVNSSIDPADHDIDAYYEDYQDEFEDYDDAWDDFEDNEEYWEDY